MRAVVDVEKEAVRSCLKSITSGGYQNKQDKHKLAWQLKEEGALLAFCFKRETT
jgi:hypothetical protein